MENKRQSNNCKPEADFKAENSGKVEDAGVPTDAKDAVSDAPVSDAPVSGAPAFDAPVSAAPVSAAPVPVVSEAGIISKTDGAGDVVGTNTAPQSEFSANSTVDEKEKSFETTKEVESHAIQEIILRQEWHTLYEAVVGLSHRDKNPPLPCQDSAWAGSTPRPIVIVADGAGSSVVSELGSQAVVKGVARLANTLEKSLVSLLDHPETPTEKAVRAQGMLFVKHAKGILDDLATDHRRPQKDFRCTLLLALYGKNHLLWVKIGDGALVVEEMQNKGGKLHPCLVALGEIGKGEFANQTTFLDDHLKLADVQIGICPSDFISGFAAMSDGAADRLVANDGSRVAPRVSSWLAELRQGKLKRRALTRAFYSDDFTRGAIGDDISVALATWSLQAPLSLRA